MKHLNTIFLSFFLFFCTEFACSQVSVGAFGGVHFANLSKEISNTEGWSLDTKYTPHLVYGLSLDFQVNRILSVSADVSNIEKGYRSESTTFKGTETDPITWFDFRLKYKELGTLLKISPFNPKFCVQPYFLAGTTVGYLQKSSHTTNYISYPDAIRVSMPLEIIYDDSQRIDYGLIAGIGGKTRIISNTYLTFEGRYHHGLTIINGFQNRGIQLRMGVAQMF